MEKFSVLMSVYAREKPAFLDLALSSVFKQTVPPEQVVLVEDGPLNDGLYSVVNKYKEQYPNIFEVVSLPENLGSKIGLGEAWNIGLAKCRNELVARMDSDDICLFNRFERQLQIFEKQPELDIVGAWVSEFTSDPDIVDSIKKVPQRDAKIKRYAKSRCPFNHPSVMFRKSTIDSYGGYIPFHYIDDYYLWARMVVGGARMYNIDECLVQMRTGDGLFARRGGIRYTKYALRLQKKFLEIGLISYAVFIKNVTIQVIVRMIPNRMRVFIYKKFLRR